MNIHQITVRVLALVAILTASAGTTVADKREPTVTSTTTSEETRGMHPMQGSSSSQTTTTQSR